MKQCSKCKEFKDESEFHKRKGRPNGSSGCKICKNKSSQKWGTNHKRIRDRREYSRMYCEANPNYHKNYHETHKDELKNKLLQRLYGITLEKYNKLFETQSGCCAICGRHQSELKISLHIDHDHKTGMIRGLLCNRCNPLIGFADNNINILESAIEYLTKIS